MGFCKAGHIANFPICKGSNNSNITPYCMREDKVPSHLYHEDGLPIGWNIIVKTLK